MRNPDSDSSKARGSELTGKAEYSANRPFFTFLGLSDSHVHSALSRSWANMTRIVSLLLLALIVAPSLFVGGLALTNEDGADSSQRTTLRVRFLLGSGLFYLLPLAN